LLPNLRRDSETLKEKLATHLAALHPDGARTFAEAPVVSETSTTRHHCAACGHLVPKAPFCQQCGATQPMALACPGCDMTHNLPLHFLSKEAPPTKDLFCTQCGTNLTSLVRR
jgi:hypothetical protein